MLLADIEAEWLATIYLIWGNPDEVTKPSVSG
jgi:hypothetical protein